MIKLNGKMHNDDAKQILTVDKKIVSYNELIDNIYYIYKDNKPGEFTPYFVQDTYSFDSEFTSSAFVSLFERSTQNSNNETYLKQYISIFEKYMNEHGIYDIQAVIKREKNSYLDISVSGNKIVNLDKRFYTELYKASNGITSNYVFNGKLLVEDSVLKNLLNEVIIEDINDLEYYAESLDNGEKDRYNYLLMFKDNTQIVSRYKTKIEFLEIHNFIVSRSNVHKKILSNTEMLVACDLDLLNVSKRCNWCGKELGCEEICPKCKKELYINETQCKLQKNILGRLGVNTINDFRIDSRFVVATLPDEGEIQAQYNWSPNLSYIFMRNLALENGHFEESFAFLDDIKYVKLESEYHGGIKRNRFVVHFKDEERFPPIRFDHVYMDKDHHIDFQIHELSLFESDDFDYINIDVTTKNYSDAIMYHHVHLNSLYETHSYDSYMKELNNRIKPVETPAKPVVNNSTNNGNKFEEIKKFKELLDMGIISQEEFDKKKKEILGV